MGAYTREGRRPPGLAAVLVGEDRTAVVLASILTLISLAVMLTSARLVRSRS